MLFTCPPTIRGSYMARLSHPTRVGIPSQESFMAAQDSTSAPDLESVSLVGLDGAGTTGTMTGTTDTRISTTIRTSPTAARSLTATTSTTATVISTTPTGFTEAALGTETLDSMAGRLHIRSQEHTLAHSVALITAEMPEAFLLADSRALEAEPMVADLAPAAASMVAEVFMAVVALMAAVEGTGNPPEYAFRVRQNSRMEKMQCYIRFQIQLNHRGRTLVDLLQPYFSWALRWCQRSPRSRGSGLFRRLTKRHTLSLRHLSRVTTSS